MFLARLNERLPADGSPGWTTRRVSLMDVLSGAPPLIVDVRQTGSGPIHRDLQLTTAGSRRWTTPPSHLVSLRAQACKEVCRPLLGAEQGPFSKPPDEMHVWSRPDGQRAHELKVKTVRSPFWDSSMVEFELKYRRASIVVADPERIFARLGPCLVNS
jgi:hypothetical protein